jgi:UDP-N-acetylmuramoyl-tripeptide--D-alanyl-D-alanine ligase
MYPAGASTPLTQRGRPQVASGTTSEPVDVEYFGSREAIADAKAEIFTGLEPGGVAVLNRDNAQFERLAAAATAAGVARIVSFGEHDAADVRARQVRLHADCSIIDAVVLGEEITYKLGVPGRHQVNNSLAVLAAVMLSGADLALAALTLAQLQPPVGRGARLSLAMPGGGAALLIDESYNAKPASMRAAIALLGQMVVGLRGRRIAVLGDMLELGPQSPALHAGLAAALADANIDLVFCAGPLMRELFETLPSTQRGGYAETAAALEPVLVSVLHSGDAVMVKGSLGSKMGPVVKALTQAFPVSSAAEDAPA